MAKVMPRMKSRVRKIVLATLTMPGNRKIFEKRAQPIIAVQQMLGNDFRLADHRHEVRVSLPARHHVPVEMILHPRPGATAEVHPQIDAPGLQRRENNGHRGAQGGTEVMVFLPGEGRHFVRMPFRRQQQMARVVGIFVQHDEGMVRLSEKQAGAGIRGFQLIAEDTPRFLRPVLDVGHPPRRPDGFHRCLYSEEPLPSTLSLSSLPTLKNGTFLAATDTTAPLFGFLPSRARRCLMTKLPNPRISILSPWPIASTIESKIES